MAIKRKTRTTAEATTTDVQSIAKPEPKEKQVSGFTDKRKALDAMVKHGATRIVKNSSGKRVSTDTQPEVIQGKMTVTTSRYVFEYTNLRGTVVRSCGDIKLLELTPTSLNMKCYNGDTAFYTVSK